VATRALVFDLVGRDKSLGRTFDQMSRKSRELGRSFHQAGMEAGRATDKLRLGVDKANLQLKQAEITASKARASHARAARLFGRDSDQAYQAALRVGKAQIGVREATLRVADATDHLSKSADRNVQVAHRSSQRWQAVGVSLGKVAKTAALAGAALAAAAVVGAARFAAAGVKAAASFDKTMRQFAVVADVPKAQFKGMSELALKMGKDTTFSASQAAQAMLDLAKGGLTAAQIKGGALQATLTLAAAGGIELAQAGATMANALNMFGLKAKDAASVAAAFAGGANASSASVDDLTLALAQVGPGARNAGLSMQQTVGTLASFHNWGLKGSDAGTSLKTMLARLVPQTKKAAEKMKELGLDFTDAHGAIVPITTVALRLQERLGKLTQEQQATALATIFGSDATRAATILMKEGGLGLAKYIKATHDRGAAEALAKTNTEGAAGALEKLRGSIETIMIRLGGPLLTPLAKLAEWLADKLPVAAEKTGAWFKRLWDTIEPVRAAIGRLWETVKTSAGEIGGALVSAFKAISPSVGEGKGAIEGFARFIRVDVVNAVKSFTDWLVNKGIPGFLDFVDHYINDFAKPVGKATLSMIDFIVHAMTNWLRVSLRVAGGILHGFATAFQFVPILGEQIKKSSAGFDSWADGVIGSMETAGDATTKAKEVGGRALDALGKNVEGARARYEKFQAQAKIPLTVKIAANINALADGLASGKIKMGEFRIRANAELAKVTSSPARKRMQELLNDVATGKIKIGEFRQKWNAEMRKLQNAERIASVIARLKSPATLKSDLAKARHLVGIGATGGVAQHLRKVYRADGGAAGPIFGPGTETSDSIPAMLSRNEHVISAREVRGAGGHEALEQMRSTWRGAAAFATGGAAHRRDMERWHWARARRVSAMGDDARYAWARRLGLPPSPPGRTWYEDYSLGRDWNHTRGHPSRLMPHLYRARHKYFARTGYAEGGIGYAQGGQAFRVETSGLAGLGARLQRQTLAVDNFVEGVGRYLATQANQKLNKEFDGLGGPGIVRALRWARGQEGKPYIWGGVGPRGYDCSGFMSAITNVIMGRSPYHRLFATGSFPTSGWARGFVRAGFNIGSRRGNPGHMAGTLGGVPVESRGSRGVIVGAGARGAGSSLFGGNIWHLMGRSGSNSGKERFIGLDRGGWLPPGPSLVYNGTGRPERVPHPRETGTLTIEKGAVQINVYGSPGQSSERLAELVDARLHASLGSVLGSVRARRAR
jgi:TP901 family phage tail tape measure protein